MLKERDRLILRTSRPKLNDFDTIVDFIYTTMALPLSKADIFDDLVMFYHDEDLPDEISYIPMILVNSQNRSLEVRVDSSSLNWINDILKFKDNEYGLSLSKSIHMDEYRSTLMRKVQPLIDDIRSICSVGLLINDVEFDWEDHKITINHIDLDVLVTQSYLTNRNLVFNYPWRIRVYEVSAEKHVNSLDNIIIDDSFKFIGSTPVLCIKSGIDSNKIKKFFKDHHE